MSGPPCVSDIRTWHSNIEQHASEGVNKILIGNKCDCPADARQVTVDQGRELADELGLRFLETSAKANEGVEEAFFTLGRDIKVRLIDSQEGAAGTVAGGSGAAGAKSGNVAVGASNGEQSKGGCC